MEIMLLHSIEVCLVFICLKKKEIISAIAGLSDVCSLTHMLKHLETCDLTAICFGKTNS